MNKMLKRVSLLLSVLLVASCVHSEPAYTTEQMFLFDQGYIVADTEKFSLDDVESAMAIFYIEWAKTFGDPRKRVFGNLSDITIFIGKDLQVIENVYDTDGMKHDVAEVKGLTYAPNFIWFWAGFPQDKLSDTSLVHELVHASLWKLHGTGDPDHEGGKTVLWTKEHTVFIENVNQLLRGKNL